MKNFCIKNSRYLALGAVLLTGSMLTACGGDEPDYNNPDIYSSYYGNNAGCQVPTGIKNRTVTGNFGNGATLTLDFYNQTGGGTVAAYGVLTIPSVESLFGVAVFNGNSNGNSLINGYTGNNSQFSTCVSSNGYAGTMQQDGTYQEISLALTGNGNAYIEMGSSVGNIPAYVSGNYLQGQVKMRVGQYPDTYFILAH